MHAKRRIHKLCFRGKMFFKVMVSIFALKLNRLAPSLYVFPGKIGSSLGIN
jgi:hypothetical protein